jgi:hypothetical protein
MQHLRVVIVYLSTDLIPRANAWCAARGWTVAATVSTPRYLDALAVLSRREADIILAASEDSLDPDRIPRVEIVPEDFDGSSEWTGWTPGATLAP